MDELLAATACLWRSSFGSFLNMWMKVAHPIHVVVMACLAIGSAGLHAAPSPPPKAPLADNVVVTQGDVKLTLEDMDAFAAKVPPKDRPGFFNNAKRLDTSLRALLLNRQIAAEARQMGLDKDPSIQRQAELAVEEVLTRARMARFRDELTIPDFSALAREKYLTDPDSYTRAEVVNVRHILIGIAKRSDEEAQTLAKQVRDKAVADPTKFQALVGEYSDDPSKDDNKGLMGDATGRRYVPEFMDAARLLKKPGEISPLVKTKFGYHILILENIEPARRYSYEDVGPSIVNQLSDDFVRARVAEHIGKAQGIPIESNAELVSSLRSRYDVKGAASPDSAAVQEVEQPAAQNQ